MMNEKTDIKPDMAERIKKYPMWCGAGWIALLGVLTWAFPKLAGWVLGLVRDCMGLAAGNAGWL